MSAIQNRGGAFPGAQASCLQLSMMRPGMAALPGDASIMAVSYGFLPGRVCAHCGYEEIYLQLFSIIAAVYTTPASFNLAREFLIKRASFDTTIMAFCVFDLEMKVYIIYNGIAQKEDISRGSNQICGDHV